MTDRHPFTTVFALLALLLGGALFALLGGCGRNDANPAVAEIEDPAYKQAKQLLRQGREQEALATFLRVIESRGSRNSAESHLEAGVLFKEHLRNPVFAIYHFQTYLELRPTSPEARSVRELVAAATREFAKTLPARPAESQSVRLELADEVERLRRENEEMRAQLATLRGGAAPLTRGTGNAGAPAIARNPPSAPAMSVTSAPLPILQPAPLPNAPQLAPANPAATTRTNPPSKTTAKKASTGGRTYTVKEKDGLWKIARDHYGQNASGAQVQALFEANRDVMKDYGDLKPGMTLKIP